MDPDDLWKLVLLFVCLALSAFFSASETSYIALSRVRVIHLVNTGRSGAARVSHLLQRPDKLLATVLLGNNLVNTAAAALATAVAISFIDNTNVALLVATLGTTVLLLVFSETLPKSLAWARAERVAFFVSRPLTSLGWLLSPGTSLLQGISYMARRSLGIAPAHFQVTEEEVRTMISVGARAGAVDPTEAEMLEKVFHFGDRQVQEIMTPRTEIVWVEKSMTLEEFLEIYSENTHTRFPAYDGDMENIIGILSVKDLLQAMAKRGRDGVRLADVLRPSHFIPETKLVGQLFSELRESGQQMAIVIDQFGGVAGLVTLKRLLEVIVGPVGEEGEPAREEFAAIGDNAFDIDAGIGIQEANDELGLRLPDGNYQTLAGFILERLGHIPKEGERLYYQNLCLEVVEMRGVKIERVEVRWVGEPVEQREG